MEEIKQKECGRCFGIINTNHTYSGKCKATQEIKQKEAYFSPRDVAIQVMKAIEVADISQWNGKNVIEASDYDAIFD